ncbi:hypothetical protein JYU34_010721 [Plutella xylostella]|uniref:RRM domain-containing protein n=1 Tax=Plutella xylostella TaxID=51655 RepID=A0ABQ7QGB6_PLUXY|nr:hypothetical protein JYU34_010721 [Plutella xylostella]
MNDRRQKDRPDDRKEDVPPFSRVFVVCPKTSTKLTEAELRPAFEQCGTIESLYMPVNKGTGELKGIAYIKYTKTSSAARAIQKYNLKCLDNCNRPIKVMVANQRNEAESKFDGNRLFIVVPKNETEDDIRTHFSQFGGVHQVYFQKKSSFAYVIYYSFLEAAIALEECDRKYKAVFAVPKDELKRSRDNFEYNSISPHLSQGSLFNNENRYHNESRYMMASPNHPPEGYKRVGVTVTPQLPERFIGSLFNIIPGMEKLEYSTDNYNDTSKAIITYSEHKYAVCAVDRLNNFEFPSGEIISVKPDTDLISRAATDLTQMVQSLKNAMDTGSSPSDLVHLADAIAQASSLIKVATTSIAEPSTQDQGFCNVKLPPIQSLADSNAVVAKRCFVVFKPQPPPIPVLRDVFCRFGSFIDIIVYPGKTYGFVKYASARSADEAIKVLHGASILGVRLKVLEADEKQSKEDSNGDRKRQRMDHD